MEEEALGQGKVVYWIAFDSGSERERERGKYTVAG